MNIRNRLADVKKLCTNALQDFLKLVIKADWKNDFYNICKKNVEEGNHPEVYPKAYEGIRAYGLEKYDITQMDITLMCALLLFNSNLLKYKLSSKTRKSVTVLKEDRNFKDHSDENEADDELYLTALVSLYNLRKFVDTEDLDVNIPDSDKKLAFKQKYEKAISELMFKIDDERFELVAKYKQFQKDVDQILNARNEKKHEMYSNICESYREKSRADENNRYLMYEFNAYAYERGIDDATFGAIAYYDHVKDFKKLNSTYKSIFYKIPKNDTSALVKEINEYLILVCLVRKEVKGPLDESFNDCFETIGKLGFKIIKNKKGVYTLADSDNKVQSSDK